MSEVSHRPARLSRLAARSALALMPFLLGSLPDIAAAQREDVFSGNVIMPGGLCAGSACAPGESFDAGERVKLKHDVLRLSFHDTDTGTYPPGTDWQLYANDSTQYGYNRFSIRDMTANTIPFSVEAGAPENTFWIAGTGNVGIGTSMPLAELTVFDESRASLRLEDSFAGGGAWELITWGGSFSAQNMNNGQFALNLAGNAMADGLNVVGDKTGIGTLTPKARLHVDLDDGEESALYITDGPDGFTPYAMAHILSFDGNAELMVQNSTTNPSETYPRRMLWLINGGRPEIVMSNTSTGGEWSFGAGTNFVLKTGAFESTDAEKIRHLKLYGATGDLEITGQIITGGPTCASGCDAVFSEGYDLPTVEEHAAEMFALGHLPNVGPTAPGQPVNMSEQYGKLLNELEHAHIYIAEMNARLAGQTQEITGLKVELAEMRGFEARLRALEDTR